MRYLSTFILASCVLLLVGELRAQSPVASSQDRVQIAVGQSIADVQRMLRDRGIEFVANSLELEKNDAIDYLSFDLDKPQTFAVVFYSKTKRVVTDIDFVSWPVGHQAKLTRSWLRVKSISLDSDGSYSVKFLLPTK